MKKIILLFVILVTFNSCSSDNESTSTFNSSLLIGKWETISITTNGQASNLDKCSTGTYKEYKTDNSYLEYYVCGTTQYIDKSTYSVSNNIITFVLNDPGQDPPIFKMTITELTKTSLNTSFEYTENGKVFKTNIVYKKID